MKYRFKGLDEYIARLDQMRNPNYVNYIIEKAVEEGSKVVEEATAKELMALPVDNRPYVKGDGKEKGQRNSITQLQKDHLLIAFGLSPISDVARGQKDFTNKKTGVDKSTNKIGQPAVTIARRLEDGTSYMKKNPVFTRASRKARTDCLNAMEKSLNQSIAELWKSNFKI